MPKEKDDGRDDGNCKKKKRMDAAGPSKSSGSNQQETTRRSLAFVPGYIIDNVDVYSDLFVMSSSRSTVLVVDYRLHYVYAIMGGPTEKKPTAPNTIRCATRELRDNRCLGCPKFGVHRSIRHTCGGLEPKEQIDLTLQQLHRFYMCVGHHFDKEFQPEDYTKSYYGTIYAEAFHCCIRWMKRTFFNPVTRVTHPVWKYEDDAEGAGSWSFFERSLSSAGSKRSVRSIHLSEWESRRHSNVHLQLPNFSDCSLNKFWHHLNKEGPFQIWTLCKAKRWLRHRDDVTTAPNDKGKTKKMRPVGVVSTGGSPNRRGQISTNMWSPVKYKLDELLNSIKNYDPRPGLSGRGLHLPIYSLKEEQQGQPPPGGLPHPPVDVKRYENWARNRYLPPSASSVGSRRKHRQSPFDDDEYDTVSIGDSSSSSEDDEDDVVFIREYSSDVKPALLNPDLFLSSEDESDSIPINNSSRAPVSEDTEETDAPSEAIPNNISAVNHEPSCSGISSSLWEKQSKPQTASNESSEESQETRQELIPSPPISPITVPHTLIAITDRDDISHFAVQNLITFVDAPDEMAEYFFQTIRRQQMLLQEEDRRVTEQWIEDVKQRRAVRNTQLLIPTSGPSQPAPPSPPQSAESKSGLPPKKNLHFR